MAVLVQVHMYTESRKKTQIEKEIDMGNEKRERKRKWSGKKRGSDAQV